MVIKLRDKKGGEGVQGEISADLQNYEAVMGR